MISKSGVNNFTYHEHYKIKLKDQSPENIKAISKLSQFDKINIAIEKILNYEPVYFNNPHFKYPTPFDFSQLKDVEKKIKNLNLQTVTIEYNNDDAWKHNFKENFRIRGVVIYLKR